MSMKEKKLRIRVKHSHPGIFLMLRTMKRIMNGDALYIKNVLRFGDDPDNEYIVIKHNGNRDYKKIIYVIEENSNREGFCATLRFVIGYLIYAGEHGFAPVICMTENFAYYDEEMSREISNPWEYYFVVSKENYDESKAMHVCYSEYHHMMTIKEYSKLNAYLTENYYDESLFQVCSPIINKYLVLKPDIVSEATELLARTKAGGGMVLGIHFRGTDFKQGYNEHPVRVDEEQIVEGMLDAMKTVKFAAVFLATDDASVYDRIKEAIGDTELLQYTGVYRSDGDKSVAFSEDERPCHHYMLGYEIARDMYTLSICDGLVAGKSSVSFLSNLYKHSRDEKYEYLHIIDNGNNRNDKTV